MAFVPLKPKSQIFKVADLHGQWMVGKYIQKTKGDYSFIYWLEEEAGQILKVYGNKSLDTFMDDSLLGKLVAITCTELRDTGKAHPFAVASVSIWDPDASTNPSEQTTAQTIPKP